MIHHYTFSVLGGDRRMVYAAQMLAMAGFRVLTFGLTDVPCQQVTVCDQAEEALRADFILLPVPMSRDGRTLFAPALRSPLFISEILEKTPSHATVFGGKTDVFSDPRLADYGKRADFSALNALPTAEGALLLAMEHLPCTVSDAQVGILGFGRIGKATAACFRAVGAKTSVFARREEVCSVATLLGYEAHPLSELASHAGELRCLINTVPAPVIDENTLSTLRSDALILELASPPYGVDFELAKKMGVRTVLGSGLPGKYSPETAGLAVARTVLTMLCEKGISI